MPGTLPWTLMDAMYAVVNADGSHDQSGRADQDGRAGDAMVVYQYRGIGGQGGQAPIVSGVSRMCRMWMQHYLFDCPATQSEKCAVGLLCLISKSTFYPGTVLCLSYLLRFCDFRLGE